MAVAAFWPHGPQEAQSAGRTPSPNSDPHGGAVRPQGPANTEAQTPTAPVSPPPPQQRGTPPPFPRPVPDPTKTDVGPGGGASISGGSLRDEIFFFFC